jgi:hypothetical protein
VPRRDDEVIDWERRRRNRNGPTSELPNPGNVDPRSMPDYKPPIPTIPGEEVVDDYRTRKQKYQESLGVGGRKAFRKGLNENWDRIARAYLSGTPLEDLIERYGEGGGPREGRNSVAWDQWTSGNNPGLQRAIRNKDMFQGAISRGRVKEWPPGSGRYYGQWFGNKPQWFDSLGNVIGDGGEPPPMTNPTAPTAAPINPGDITSGGVTYNPGTRPPPNPVGPPVGTNVAQPPSYMTGSPAMQPHPAPWYSNQSQPMKQQPSVQRSPYSMQYNTSSPNARGMQQRRRMPWTLS